MGELQLPWLGRKPIVLNDPRPKIKCANRSCGATTLRDIRLADGLPAPADAGWYEVELQGTRRTVLFACSRRCAQQVAAVANIVPDLSALSEHPVLPE